MLEPSDLPGQAFNAANPRQTLVATTIASIDKCNEEILGAQSNRRAVLGLGTV
jgi:hypothetical protein